MQSLQQARQAVDRWSLSTGGRASPGTRGHERKSSLVLLHAALWLFWPSGRHTCIRTGSSWQLFLARWSGATQCAWNLSVEVAWVIAKLMQAGWVLGACLGGWSMRLTHKHEQYA